MLKRKQIFILFLTFFILFAFSIPNIIYKFKTETSSKNVEMVVDLDSLQEIVHNSNEPKKTYNELIKTLKKNGVTTIGLSENTLEKLSSRDYVELYDGKKLSADSKIYNLETPFNKDYSYLYIKESDIKKEVLSTIKSSIHPIFPSKELTFNGQTFLEVEGSLTDIKKLPLLYLESDYKTLSKDFYISPRVSNDWEERINLLNEQLYKWKDEEKLSFVIFNGTEVQGYNGETGKVNINYLWNELGIGYLEVFSKARQQKGINNYAYDSHFNVVRVHSLSKEEIEKLSPETISNRIKRAASERNIKIFYLNLPITSYDYENKNADKLGNLLNETSQKIKDKGLYLEKTEKFDNPKLTIINQIGLYSSFFASIILIVGLLAYAFPTIKTKYIYSLLILPSLLVVFLGVLGKESVLSALFPLGVSILVPTFCMVVFKKHLDNTLKLTIKSGLLLLSKIVSLIVIGISLILSVDYTIEYILYLKSFRGVSLTFALPSLLIVFYLIFSNRKGNLLQQISNISKRSIRVIDVVIVFAALGFFYYYLSRTGNDGVRLPFEMVFREGLEGLLDVRPRTKEFLFAIPLAVISAFYWHRHKIFQFLLPIIVIGFASMINTFTHLHTPIFISAYRTSLSIILGVLVGVIGLFIINLLLKIIRKTIKKLP